MSFTELGLQDELMQSIKEKGFTQATEIQQLATPHILAGKDVIAGSSTGSGKTLAFGLGVLHHVEKGKGIQALVITPTRELAEQIYEVLKNFSKHKKLNIITIYGGVSINPQFAALKKADIVVGTPGRILDHVERDSINLKNIKHLILDEADRLLDMGFLPDITKIINICPKDRQTLLFSATLNHEVNQIAKRFMDAPEKVDVSQYVDPSKLTQVYYDVKVPLKFSLLTHFLKEEQAGLVMVFCNSRKYVDMVAKSLSKQGLDALGIHGGLTQAKRNAVLKKFHTNKAFVLVCTDVAARGLDIPNVSHVYNYDIPLDSKQYVHRAGRTARAGKSGRVINLISDRDYDNFSKVVNDNRDMKIQKEKTPFVERVELLMPSRRKSNFSGPRTGGSSTRGRGQSQDRSPRGYASNKSGGRARSYGESNDPAARGYSSADNDPAARGYSSRKSNYSRSR